MRIYNFTSNLKFLLFVSFVFVVSIYSGFCQSVSTSVPFPKSDAPLTITVNVKRTSLQGYPDQVWLWSWIDNPGQDYDAPTNVNPASSPAQDAALMSRSLADPDIYSITITPAIFFNKPAAEINRMGLKLKSRAWDDNKQSDNDLFIDFFEEGFASKLLAPVKKSIVLKSGETLPIEVATSETADKIELYFDASLIASASNVAEFKYTYSSSSAGDIKAKVVSHKGGEEDQTFEFSITVIQPALIEERPENIRDGISYIDDHTVILSLLAPMKDFVVLIGDFNDWKVSSSYQMKKTPDGERYWFQLTGLTKGVEYGFQYLVDGEIRVADPFADKILNPDDQYIPSNSYANPKPFPGKANFGEWYEKRVSVFQTGQEAYQWEVINFESPKKEELVIYELLLRDFFSADERHYNNLIDTLTYLKRLGVNAIELMPVTEFNGNDSWGYNPAFMFAVDKAYGSKNMLKHFIDEAHKVGIAVILDMVLNQQDRPNPYLEMYWEGNAPAQDNPWFNRTAKHPFNVFSDMNHESAYTKAYVDTVSHYWLTEYKFDGLRFDLSKGFTQQDNLNNEQAWTSYDASRIAILKRIASKIWSYKPQAYVMLEHLGSDQEEKELADAGMMLWGNMNGAYKDVASGKNADLSRAYYKNRNWTQSNLITYMESHDEERLMYTALTSGLSNGSYNIRVKETALDRMKLNAAFFFLIPGPKLMWQFGEMGFDTSIRLCTDGSLKDDCRTNAKPPMWNYQNEPERAKLNKVYQKLIELRQTEAFKGGDFTWNAGELIKQLHISHPTLDIFTFGNFSTSSVGYRPSFPEKGKWYDYLSGDSIDVLIMYAELTLEPGEFHIYTNKRLTATNENLVPFRSDLVLSSQEGIVKGCFIYPNPSSGVFMIKGAKSSEKIFISDMAGRSINYKIDDFRDYKTIQLEEPKAGIYLLEIKGEVKPRRIKLKVE